MDNFSVEGAGIVCGNTKVSVTGFLIDADA